MASAPGHRIATAANSDSVLHQPPVKNHWSRAITGHEPRVTSHWSRATGHESPATTYQPQIKNHQLPATSHESRITTYHLPSTSHESRRAIDDRACECTATVERHLTLNESPFSGVWSVVSIHILYIYLYPIRISVDQRDCRTWNGGDGVVGPIFNFECI